VCSSTVSVLHHSQAHAIILIYFKVHYIVYLQERSCAKKCNQHEMIHVWMFVIKCGIALCCHAFDEPTYSPLEKVPASATQIRDIETGFPRQISSAPESHGPSILVPSADM
jgi:hypothetical protein